MPKCEGTCPMIHGTVSGQSPQAAQTAHLLHHAATDLWDAATNEDAAQMWEDARRIASRILAACPSD